MKKITKLIIFALVALIGSILLFIPTLKNINFGLDLQGGFEMLYKVEPLLGNGDVTEDELNKTYDAIVNRIDTLGVSEPVITFEGKNTLRIQLPGVENETEARDIISTTALLSFRDTSDNLLMTSAILGSSGANADKNTESLKPVVKLDIKDTATFYNVTKNVSKSEDNRIVIWLDYNEETDSFINEESTCGSDENNKCLSVAYVNEGLNSNSVIIEGNFTQKKVDRLVDLINAGSLPTKLVSDSTPHSVSASFGEKTIKTTAIAGIISLALISLLLIIKYRFAGLLSSISLIVYSLLIFLTFNGVGGVLTLPGIAALILGIGMAVDSAIVFIERIKDEYKDSLTSAYKNGNKKSLVAIIDANITTFIVAVILYIFGESSIKGFATMLIISIIITALTMVILNRFFIKKSIDSGAFDKNTNLLFGTIKKKKEYNFIKINKFAVFGFVAIVAVGVIFALTKGINFGIDFSGGTSINMTSETAINFDEILPLVSDYDVEECNYYINTKNEGYIKLNKLVDENSMKDITTTFENMGIDTSVNEISTMVVEKLTKNAIYSLLLSFIAIIIYVAIRFNFNFGIAGIAALFHDVILMIISLIVLNMEFNFIIVAALLTIIGYSINDTIVVFDRIRDNKKVIYKGSLKTKEDVDNLMNKSMSEVLSRNILTTITTLIAVLSLIILGVNEILTFNTAILVGLLGGAVSSIVFAPNLWRVLERKNINKPKKQKKNYDEIDEMSIKGINS